jgi:hypothetical protein
MDMMNSLSDSNTLNYLPTNASVDLSNKIIPSVYGTCIVQGKVFYSSDIMEQETTPYS